MTKYKCKKMLG